MYGTVICGLQCHYCLGKPDSALSSEKYTQFTGRGLSTRHVSFHERPTAAEELLHCPVPGCGIQHIKRPELRIHFRDMHKLKPKGYTKSRGLATESTGATYNGTDGDSKVEDSEVEDDSDCEKDWPGDSVSELASSKVSHQRKRESNDLILPTLPSKRAKVAEETYRPILPPVRYVRR